MTPDSYARELSDGTRVIDASYRNRSDRSRLTPLTSSSSSSSLSGITTPVDGVPPKLVAFPKSSPAKTGLTSSGSSSSSLDKHRVRSLSFSRQPQSPIPRPAKLSLESAKSSPIPAIPSSSEDHSPLGAFSLTSSAEGHLRSLVSRVVSPQTSSKIPDALPNSTFTKRERTSSLRSLPVPWASISDIEEEEETFWPRQNSATRHDVPSISRSLSPSKPLDNGGSTVTHNPRSRFASARSVTAPKPGTQSDLAKSRKQARSRADSFAGPSSQTRAMATSHFSEATSAPRAFLRPPVKAKGKTVARPPLSGIFAQTKEGTALDPALAAAESASRLRAKCVCLVCGKLGADFPRCPRCPATWCSRDCRMSSVPAGSARHSCNGKKTGKIATTPSPLSVGA